MEEIIAVLDTLERSHASGQLDQEQAVRAFTRLKEEFGSEFHQFELSYCAHTVVVPLVRESLADWSPLAGRNESLPHLTTFTAWREVLEAGPDTQPAADAPMAAYHSLVWECWVPAVRLAVQRWQSRRPEPLVSFLELWRALVPAWVMQHVLEQLVLVRLQAEVELWDPLTDTTPIHTWLHPWLPPLGSRLEIVYPTIRNKLSSALASWHPTDRSAKLILLPWKDVFTRGAMSAFLTKNIVPKLETLLAAMPISPEQQDLAGWRAVTDWDELLPPPQLAAILAQSFFPRGLQVLAAWLNSTPNYEEVVGWYQGWKSVLPAAVLPLPGVADQLSQALHMMNRSVVGSGPLAGQPGALENVRYMTGREMQGQQAAARPATALPGADTGNKHKFDSVAEAVKTSAAIPQGFKELIGKRCEDRGIVWRPLAGRWREGKQLFLCGQRQVYLDRNVIFMMEGTVWVPCSLNSLLDKAFDG
jgi:tuftelin-interacting protein 11